MTGSPTPESPGDAVVVGPITKSPDTGKMRRRREKLRGVRLWLFERIFVPAEVPTEFVGPLDELRASIATSDPETARSILEEAQARFDEASSRIASAEMRATALQGNVAIAASLVVAGAGLFLDGGKVGSDGWRIVLVSVLVAFVLCLVASAWRAVSVTGRVFEFEQPGTERIVDRATLSGEEAITGRAAELLRAGSVTSEIGAIKIGLLSAAAWWFRIALGTLGIFIVLVAAYVISSPIGVPAGTQSQTVEESRVMEGERSDSGVAPAARPAIGAEPRPDNARSTPQPSKQRTTGPTTPTVAPGR